MISLTPRSFRFSVANNKVGHFIYALRDRIWPDFVCHFHLFNGRFAKQFSGSHWHADHEFGEILDRRPVAIAASLDFLRKGQSTDYTSAKELSKFNLVYLKHWDFSNSHDHEASTSLLVDRHEQTQIEFGYFTPPPQQGGFSALPTDRLALMEHYLSQAESEAARVIECISFGQFKCPVHA